MKKADLVLKSKAIFTGLSDSVLEGGIAISGNKIVFVGDDLEIDAWIGPNTKVLQYGDELIMPGFNDSHIHLSNGSVILDSSFSVDLSQYHSEEECVRAVKAFGEKNPENKWIYGFGWYHLLWDNKELPTRWSLDQEITERPVCLMSADFHSIWVNSKALEICEIEALSEEHEEGIGRSQNGDLNGLLFDLTSLRVTSKVFDISLTKLKSIFINFLNYAAQYGITSVADVAPVGISSAYEGYKELEEQELLTLRIHIYPQAEVDYGKALKLKEKYRSQKLRFSGVKQFVDGVSSVHTAYLLEPYSDDNSTKGCTVLPLDEIKGQIMNAQKEGVGIRLHAIGDGAVRYALDCFEEAQLKYGRKDLRHALEHIENIHKDDVERFEKLGIVASMQPSHCTFDIDGVQHVLGEERCKLSWPMKTLLNAGAVLSSGTDFPIMSLNPFKEIYAAVTRTTVDGYPDGGWNPQEKLTIAEALRAYTYGSAYVEKHENEIGTLEEGKLADIIVLNKNLFTIPSKEILNTEVILTVMDGKVVFEQE